MMLLVITAALLQVASGMHLTRRAALRTLPLVALPTVGVRSALAARSGDLETALNDPAAPDVPIPANVPFSRANSYFRHA